MEYRYKYDPIDKCSLELNSSGTLSELCFPIAYILNRYDYNTEENVRSFFKDFFKDSEHLLKIEGSEVVEFIVTVDYISDYDRYLISFSEIDDSINYEFHFLYFCLVLYKMLIRYQEPINVLDAIISITLSIGGDTGEN